MSYVKMWGVSQSSRRGKAPAVVGVVTLSLTIFAGGPSQAQERNDPQRVTIQGLVLDEVSRLPLEGVVVHFVGLGASIETDATGHFQVEGIRIGIYRIVLDHAGYRTSRGEFNVDRAGQFTLVLMPLGGDGDDEVTAGRFVGRVFDVESGQPMVGVEVHIAEIFMSGVTNTSGRFLMPAVPPGRYAVEFSSLGYATRVDTVAIVSGQTSNARVRLSLDPLVIDPIEVTLEARELALEDVGFYQRRAVGFGTFIDRTIIEETNPHKLTDLFLAIPGVSFVTVPPMGRAVVLRGGRVGLDGMCLPKVVLDGVVMDRSPDAPGLIDQLVDPANVAGIEVFPSSAGLPIQYSGINSACGVILIWTRRS